MPNDMRNKIIKYAILNALGTALYIGAVASLLFYGLKDSGPDTVLAPIVMLLLFVFSAAFTGLLVFGRPVLWYLDGEKEEAVSLLVATLGIFLVITIVALAIFYTTS